MREVRHCEHSAEQTIKYRLREGRSNPANWLFQELRTLTSFHFCNYKYKLDCLLVPLVRFPNHTEQDAREYAHARNDGTIISGSCGNKKTRNPVTNLFTVLDYSAVPHLALAYNRSRDFVAHYGASDVTGFSRSRSFHVCENPLFTHLPPQKAFTLAEVLVTLGIIGIVAAMTLPSVIGRYQEKATVTRLKKVYSILNQAYALVLQENGSPDNWLLTGNNPESNLIIMNKFLPYLNTMKVCAEDRGCFYKNQYTNLKGTKMYNHDKNSMYVNLLLYDGTSVQFRAMDKDCTLNYYGEKTVCGTVNVDINGHKGPNQYGRDFFRFLLAKDRIAPSGLPGAVNSTNFETSCAQKQTDLFGINCTAWVLINENMDYLHCEDLSWSGKTKCKK